MESGSETASGRLSAFEKQENGSKKASNSQSECKQENGLEEGLLHWKNCAFQLVDCKMIPESHTDIQESMKFFDPGAYDVDVLTRRSLKQLDGETDFTGELNFRMLAKKAEEGSTTARRLLVASDHFTRAMDKFTRSEASPTMFHDFSEAYSMERIVVRLTDIERDKLLSLVYKELRKLIGKSQPSLLDYDLRVCLIHFRNNLHEENLAFINESLKIYPEKPYLYLLQGNILNLLNRHEESLETSIRALAKFPTDVDVLYNRAVHARLVQSKLTMDQVHDTIQAYEKYLLYAPKDERRVPEAYYSMALLRVEIMNVQLKVKSKENEGSDFSAFKAYYLKGLEAEKDQLSCFIPYNSEAKRQGWVMFMIATTEVPKSIELSSEKNKLETLGMNSIRWKDPVRQSLILSHRKAFKEYNSSLSKEDGLTRVSPRPTHNKLSGPPKLDNLKSIKLREMSMTESRTYHGHILQLTSIEDAGTGAPFIYLVVEDENGAVRRCFVYNFPQNRLLQDKLGFGCRFSILNPYMQLDSELTLFIRVDDPASIILHIESQIKMCRICFKGNFVYSFNLTLNGILFTF